MSNDTTVTKQWRARPDDERFLTLDDLATAVRYRHEHSSEIKVKVSDISCVLNEDGDDLRMDIPGATAPAEMTHFSFGSICGRMGSPASYLRNLPVELAAECLNHDIQHTPNDAIMPYLMQNGKSVLRAATSQAYGRIYDDEVVNAVQGLVQANSVNWKVPGVLDWATGKHNPHVDITKENTTLYASDRDVFLFLVDDEHPVEIGKLPNGEPDMLFRGFYVWNSEVGAATFGIATMYMRAVCANRILWGVENKNELTFRHSKGAPDRFLRDVRPTLIEYANSNTDRLMNGLTEARRPILPDERPDKIAWVMAHAGVTKGRAVAVLNAVEAEEGKVCMSAWDVAQGLTAVARRIPHQDQRIDLERSAKRILDAVAVAV